MPKLVYYGGELDGHEERISFAERPEIIFGVPLVEYELIKAVKDQIARAAAMEARRCLAYRFFELHSGDECLEFRYVRDSAQDKPPVIPAASGEKG